MATSPTNKRRNSGARFNLRIRYLTCLERGEFPQVAALLSLCFLQRWGAEDSCSAGLPSHLRRFPLKYKTWLASADPRGIGSWNPTFQKRKVGPRPPSHLRGFPLIINPSRDRLVESHLSKNER